MIIGAGCKNQIAIDGGMGRHNSARDTIVRRSGETDAIGHQDVEALVEDFLREHVLHERQLGGVKERRQHCEIGRLVKVRELLVVILLHCPLEGRFGRIGRVRLELQSVQ